MASDMIVLLAWNTSLFSGYTKKTPYITRTRQIDAIYLPDLLHKSTSTLLTSLLFRKPTPAHQPSWRLIETQQKQHLTTRHADPTMRDETNWHSHPLHPHSRNILPRRRLLHLKRTRHKKYLPRRHLLTKLHRPSRLLRRLRRTPKRNNLSRSPPTRLKLHNREQHNQRFRTPQSGSGSKA